MEEKKVYDWIVSLGGNCSAAGQLRQRNLMRYSMPFDNFFLRNEPDILKMLEAFNNDFKDCFLQDSLRELKNDERGNSKLEHQYQDMKSGYNIIHLFHDSKNNISEYIRCRKIINRRLERFYKYCNKNNNICFMLTLGFEISQELINKIYSVISKKLQNKKVDLLVVMFACEEDTYIHKEHIDVHSYKRKINDYDFYRSNIEWLWLDSYAVEDNSYKGNYFAKIFVKNKWIIVHLLNYFTTLIRIKLYLFGVRIDFCIGRLRREF